MPKIPFTRENARENSQRGNFIRWSRWRERKAASRLPPPSPIPIPTETPLQLDSRARAVIDMLREEITRTRGFLAGKLEPRDRTGLLRSLGELVERERVWSQRPGPPVVRMEKQRERRLPQVLDIEPVPEPDGQVAAPPGPGPVNCGPDTPIGSVPPDNAKRSMPQVAQVADMQVDDGAGI